MGDPNGIGPEVALKAFLKINLERSVPVWIGSKNIFEYYAKMFDITLPTKNFSENEELKPGAVYILDLLNNLNFEVTPGKITRQSGQLAMQVVQKGAELCMNELAHALVTAPISKEAIQKAGYNFPGHTELLAEKTGTKDVLMILASEKLRVALATIHVPLKEVAGFIDTKKLQRQIQNLHHSLIKDFDLTDPKIGVLGLNPHAGDGGVIGKEEIELINPVIEELSNQGLKIEGSFAADGYFGSQIYKKFDATFAMYHDQGLIPFKTLTFGKGVNFTAGLPIIRTSPDHGTAFNIAGKNMADEHSFLSAYQMAVKMASNRFKNYS